MMQKNISRVTLSYVNVSNYVSYCKWYPSVSNAYIVYLVKSFHLTPEWGSVEITKVMMYMLNEVIM